MSKIILTGDRPTGKLHIGHYVGSLKNRVEMQNNLQPGDKMYVMIADSQAMTDNAGNIQKVKDNIAQVALDYLAVGLDPSKVTIFIQSEVPELTEFTFYYMNLVTVARLQRNPTVKAEIQQKEFGRSIPAGFLTYPVSQTADITAFGANLVPVGEDQLAVLEQSREIVRTFNNMYAPVLVEPEAVLPANKSCLRLPGLDGKAKMSKSLGNCIFLADTQDELRAKVNKMFTDPDHIKVSDPGKIEGNTVFLYLDAFVNETSFAEFLPEYKNLDELKDHYRRGGLGDTKVKKFLFEVLNKELTPIRERRQKFAQNLNDIYKMLFEGSDKARLVAHENLAKLKHAMDIDYREQFYKTQK